MLTKRLQFARVEVIEQAEQRTFHMLHIGHFGDKGMMLNWTIVELVAVNARIDRGRQRQGRWQRHVLLQLAALRERCVCCAIVIVIVIIVVRFCAIVVVVVGGGIWGEPLAAH